MTEFRRQIVLDFAKWTALSALRSGAPIKSRLHVYRLLDAVAFGEVLQSGAAITKAKFDEWHEAETLALCTRDSRVPIGWGVKLINVYLKTAAYVGDLGRPGLRAALHPPIDRGLWEGFAEKFQGRPEILDQVCCVRRIRDIADYLTYRRIITGCRAAAAALGCSLIEVEQLWRGSATPAVYKAGKEEEPCKGESPSAQEFISESPALPEPEFLSRAFWS
jgi:hypothetical protein